ncbi:MAG TPA: ABC transporter ATP-binding protein [Anaerolineales bacterium]|nr:ABC transporter ATP-binding protein [Anaerolineales bacterium]
MATTQLSAEFTLTQRRKTDRRDPVRWLTTHTLHYWPLSITLLVGAIANAALAAAVPILIGQAFNAILGTPPDLQALMRTALLVAGTQVVRGALQFARNFSAELYGQRLERDIRDELYASLLGKSMTFHSMQPVGDTMARATNDVREINLMFSPGINLVVGSAIFMFMPLIFAPRYHASLVIIPAVYILAYFLSLWHYLRELQPITDEARRSFGQLNTRLAEAIDGMETVKGMAQEQGEIQRFIANARRYRDAFVHQGYVEARFLPLLWLAIAQAAGLLQALILYRRGLVDVGGVVGYFGLLLLFGFPTFVSLFAYSQVSLGLASARRILELINRETDLDQNKTGYSGPLRGEIEFKDVTFAYSEEGNSLEAISFKIHPGQTVAIVGQTGTGKTSLVKLVNRTYDVASGQVLVDGLDVRAWNLEALRRGISIIEQDVFLFSRTIAENISFGAPEASMEVIAEAARAAQAHEFILDLPDGYQTVIGERGVTLSGGQRQRLALARAFLTDPRILVLDDSTSAIDSATEDKIQRAIFAAARGRTTLIITHRLSQIRWADLILVLRQGKLAAAGTHEELMRTSPAYRRIFTERGGR